jgi:hypothetical protein
MSSRAEPDQPPEQLAPWKRWVCHIGYASEGVVYILVGFFAVQAAIGQHREPNGSKGALAGLGGTPLGKALLVLLALGLSAFVLWELLVAFTDPEHPHDRGGRRVWARISHVFNGLLHSVLVGQALWILLGIATSDEKQSQENWTARGMALPGGPEMVGLVGVGILIFGLWQFYRAFSGDKNKRVDLRHTPLRPLISALGIYGLAARGVLFGLVGLYLLNAYWYREPRYSAGIAGALGSLKQRPAGPWLLGIVAAGLISYGLFQIGKERYRRMADS